MKKYRLMIIDDQLQVRKDAYLNILLHDAFELVWIESLNHLTEIGSSTPVDGYVIDSVLDKGDWAAAGSAAKLVTEYLEKLPWKAPIFLVSRLWADPVAIDILTEITNQRSLDVVRFFAFQEFEQALEEKNTEGGVATVNAIQHKIKSDLVLWHESSAFDPDGEQSIRLLLLADLQYGDGATADTAVFDEQWLAKALNRDGLKPDFIVFAGDISFTGSPQEFVQAQQKLENLVRFAWGNDRLDARRERIILVPGNHDVNLRFSACDLHDWSIGDNNWKNIKDDRNIEVNDEMLSKHSDYALEPFRQFARALTGSKSWKDARSQCRVDRRFEHCGLRFFLFNTVSEMTLNDPKRATFRERPLSKITAELGVDDDPDLVFSMAVSHHGIKTGGSDVQIDNWQNVGMQYFKQHKINLWLFGHYHKHSAYKINAEPFDGDSNIGVVQAATLKIRSDGAARGFSLIELSRKDGRVIAADDYYYELGEHGVSDEKPKPKRIYSTED
ncbi:MAG: metallophosphoesterase [Sedimenticola sp.]